MNLRKEGIFKIKYKHYRTEAIETAIGTLDPGLSGSTIVDQDQTSTVVVFWDIDKREWKSIYKESIISVD